MFLRRNVRRAEVKERLSDVAWTLRQNTLLANQINAINEELSRKKNLQDIYAALKEVKTAAARLNKTLEKDLKRASQKLQEQKSLEERLDKKQDKIDKLNESNHNLEVALMDLSVGVWNPEVLFSSYVKANFKVKALTQENLDLQNQIKMVQKTKAKLEPLEKKYNEKCAHLQLVQQENAALKTQLQELQKHRQEEEEQSRRRYESLVAHTECLEQENVNIQTQIDHLRREQEQAKPKVENYNATMNNLRKMEKHNAELVQRRDAMQDTLKQFHLLETQFNKTHEDTVSLQKQNREIQKEILDLEEMSLAARKLEAQNELQPELKQNVNPVENLSNPKVKEHVGELEPLHDDDLNEQKRANLHVEQQESTALKTHLKELQRQHEKRNNYSTVMANTGTLEQESINLHQQTNQLPLQQEQAKPWVEHYNDNLRGIENDKAELVKSDAMPDTLKRLHLLPNRYKETAEKTGNLEKQIHELNQEVEELQEKIAERNAVKKHLEPGASDSG